MLNSLITACVRRRMALLFLIAIVAAYGVYAYLQTPVEAYPDVTNLQITVIAQMPGYAPEEIERQVTVPLERALNGTPGVIAQRSASLFGLSLVMLTFQDDEDKFVARTLISQRLTTAELPDGVEPQLAPDSSPLSEIYQFILTSDRHDLYQLRSTLQWTVAAQLRQLQGVADVIAFGGFLKEYHIEVDPERLAAYDLTLSDVATALQGSNINVGAGFFKVGDQEMVIRGIGFLSSPDDIRAIVLHSTDGVPVVLGDVAHVVQSHAPRFGDVGFNQQKEIVEGFVWMRRGENPSEVLKAIHAKVKDLNEHILPEGMRIVPFYDRSDLVEKTLSTVHTNLLHGFILVVAIVWLFLRSVRGSLIVASIIPLSLLVAFIGLSFLHLPANLISMGAIDFGILVDGAVVLVENVFNQLRRKRPDTRSGVLKVIIASAVDVSNPTLYSMSIIIAALLPIFTMERVEGRIFRPLSLTYSFALIGSLVFAMTLIPALCAVFLRPKDGEHGEPNFIVVLRNAYARLLSPFLQRRSFSFLLGAALLLMGGFSLSRSGSEFLPELDEGDVNMFIEMPTSISQAASRDLLQEIRRRLLSFPEVVGVLSEHGRPEDGTDNTAINMSETFIRFTPRNEWPRGLTKDKLMDDIRASIKEIPGIRFNLSGPIKDNVEEAISGVRGKAVLKIFGMNLDLMHRQLEKAKKALQGIAGIVDLELYRDASVPQLRIDLNRTALAREGISIAQANDVLETALAGKVATTVWENEQPISLRVRLPSTARTDIEQIGRLLVPTPAGNRVPLRDLADLSVGSGRASIVRESNSRYMALKFNIEGRDLGSVIQEARAKVEKEAKAPQDYYYVWTGEFESQQRAMARLAVIVPVALFIVLVLLYGALKNGRSVITIFLTMPFAVAGGFVAVYAAGIPLSISAAVGFIALLGQVSLMGLLVLSAIESRRLAGGALDESIVEGACDRLRPVIMASALAICGLLPMVLSREAGSEVQRPFAVVVVGGMITTAIVALFLLPPWYRLITSRKVATAEEDI
jgi:heavy metal efflux system protein